MRAARAAPRCRHASDRLKAVKRRASFIIAVAAAVGFLLILAATARRNFEGARLDRRCRLGDLSACGARCNQGSAYACKRIEQNCGGQNPSDCESLRWSARRRRSRF